MNDHAVTVLAALLGFVLGGFLADILRDAAAAVAAGTVLGTFVGGAAALLASRPRKTLTSWAANGGILGGAFGLAALLIDILLGL